MDYPERSRPITWVRGDAYEAYVGRWSRQVARQFLAWLGAPAGLRWLDVGCGTGALTQTILDLAAPEEVHGIDPSEAFVSDSRTRTTDKRARFAIGSATALPQETQSFDMVVSGLVLNFVPEPATALSEMVRVVKPGGTVAAYVWDYAGEMELMRYFWDAAVTLNPAARELDEGRRSSICKPEPLTSLFQAAGLKHVAGTAIDVPTLYRSFDEYWTPFLGGQGPAPGYALALSEADRAALRELIRQRLPHNADGSIHLRARAWAVRGQS